MRINLRLCISLAIISLASNVQAEEFNSVINDFDAYLQLEKHNEVKQVPIETRSYDELFSQLPKEAGKKNKPSKLINKKTNTAVAKSGVRYNKDTEQKAVAKNIGNTIADKPLSSAEQKRENKSEYNIADFSKSKKADVTDAIAPANYLTSVSALFIPSQWSSDYLLRDYGKYNVVYNPLSLFTSLSSVTLPTPSQKMTAKQRENIMQIIDQQRFSTLFNFGVAQGVGQLIWYQNLLTDKELVNKLSARYQTIDELKKQLLLKSAEIEKIKLLLSESNEKINQLEVQLTKVAKSDTPETEQKIKALTEQLALATKNNAIKESELAALVQENQQIKYKQTEITKTLTDKAAKQLATAQANIAKLQQQIEQQRKTLTADADQQVKILSANLAEQQQALQKKQAELTQAQAEQAAVRQQLTEREKGAVQAEKQLAAAQADIAKLQQQIEQQRKTLTAALTADADQQVKTLSANLAEQQQALQKKQAELTQAQAEQAAIRQQLTEREKGAVQAEKQLATAQADIAKLQQQIEQQRKTLTANADQQVKTLSANLAEQQQALQKKQAELTQAQAEQAAVRQQLTEREKGAVQAEKQLATAQADIAKLQQQIEQQRKTLTANADQQVKTLSANLAEQQQALQKKQAELTQAQAEQAAVRQQLTEREKGAVQAEKQLATAQADIAKLQQQIEQQRKTLTANADQQVKTLSANLAEQQQALQKKQAELTQAQAEQAAVHQQLNEFIANNKTLTQRIQQQMQINHQLEADITAKKQAGSSDVEELVSQLTKAKHTINLLNQEKDQLKAVNTQFVAQSAAIELLKQQIDEKKQANKLFEQQLTAAKQDINKLNLELQKQKSLVDGSIQTSQFDSLKSQLAALKLENEQLKKGTVVQSGTQSVPKVSLNSTLPTATKPIDNTVSEQNKKKNQKIIASLIKDKYNKLDANTYFKILQKGTAIKNIDNKQISFIMREQLTDGTVTVLYKEDNPVVLPYKELPIPLNSFIQKAGVGGVVKVYIKPEGGYGINGIPGQIAPNSMSIIDLKVLKVE